VAARPWGRGHLRPQARAAARAAVAAAVHFPKRKSRSPSAEEDEVPLDSAAASASPRRLTSSTTVSEDRPGSRAAGARASAVGDQPRPGCPANRGWRRWTGLTLSSFFRSVVLSRLARNGGHRGRDSACGVR